MIFNYERANEYYVNFKQKDLRPESFLIIYHYRDTQTKRNNNNKNNNNNNNSNIINIILKLLI